MSGTFTQSTPRPGEFYLFGPEMESGRTTSGVAFDNLSRLLSSPRLVLRPELGGFPPLAEQPQLTVDFRLGNMPRDLEGGFSGYWLVSERLKDVMLEADPSAFEFVECDTRFADGTKAPRYYLCDVVRVLDALDEAGSTLGIEVDEEFVNGKFYSLGGGARLTFRTDALAGVHVFMTPYSYFVVCDRLFMDAVHGTGVSDDPEESGISFIDASDV
ncbi:DUF1629 domain-containing protein [Stenotrophomonas oahuensis]|uniref:DUF1629 domain-containing protein n=1 Tax=Stenotrophomonas oahuensis TaxID=3003271 RepID=A0ABY9YPT2_9GAMM|nr:DUF1629 domain-containing protein [Stenotrophomonas sp. A5586]WNH52747.1 DUF1629 domain-containing protein [Stenotrophomonas sp. A5586]